MSKRFFLLFMDVFPISIYVFSALWQEQPTIVRVAFVQCTQWTCPSTYLAFPQFWKSQFCSIEIYILFNGNLNFVQLKYILFSGFLNFIQLKSLFCSMLTMDFPVNISHISSFLEI